MPRNKITVSIAFILVLALIAFLSACTSVDETTHCVETRYGTVVDKQMSPGLNPTFTTEVTCFPTTEQNFPDGHDENDKPLAESIVANTADKLEVGVDFAATWRYRPGTVFETFQLKRTPEQAMIEVHNAFREAPRIALTSWTVNDLLSPRREAFRDSVRAVAQRALGKRYEITGVTVRNISLPQQITQAQLAAIQAQRDRVTAMEKMRTDSVNALASVMKAEAQSKIRQLQAAVYEQSPQQLQLDMARAQAQALAGIFSKCTSNCILGGTVQDAFLAGGAVR